MTRVIRKRTHRLVLCLCLLALGCPASLQARRITVSLANPAYGIQPGADNKQFCSQLRHLLDSLRQIAGPSDEVVIKLQRGAEYHLYVDDAMPEEMYISNHDQDQPKRVGIRLKGWSNLTLQGNGAQFICHGRMLPVALTESRRCTLKGFAIDFDNPHITQIEVLRSDTTSGITFRVAPWVRHRINDKGHFEAYGDGWTHVPFGGIAFEKKSRHIVYRTSDIGANLNEVRRIADDIYVAPHWRDTRLVPTTIVALRSYHRPAPGIFLADDEDTDISEVKVHYAEGMGLLAQRCNNIKLSKFGVCLRGADDPRYFTTQADATHFSQCRGVITSVGGLYEGMMDDAINVHGIYLKVMERIDSYTLRLAYGHNQSWGFAWGDVGDKVRFVDAKRMQDVGVACHIASIKPADRTTVLGCKEFVVSFDEQVPEEVVGGGRYGAEDMDWTPEVYFADNIVRNNRARGALFSSPLRTVCERNLFDHTSGSAIVLCGDCNGWFESGAVRDLVIRKNRFANALTCLFQFTNAVISIYPEIPDIKSQTACFHGGKHDAIVITDNIFETFDHPLLYAKSTHGLRFENNKVVKNNDYPAFHPNNKPVCLEHVEDCTAPGYDIK